MSTFPPRPSSSQHLEETGQGQALTSFDPKTCIEINRAHGGLIAGFVVNTGVAGQAPT